MRGAWVRVGEGLVWKRAGSYGGAHVSTHCACVRVCVCMCVCARHGCSCCIDRCMMYGRCLDGGMSLKGAV